jgi:tight adherence protein C
MALDPTALLIGMMVFGAVMFGLMGLAWGGQSAGSVAARQRLEGFKRGSAEAPEETPAHAPFGQRVLTPMLHNVAAAFGNLLPKSMLSGVEKTLIYAGEPMNLQGFLTMAVVSFGSSVLLSFLIVFASGVGIGPVTLGLGGFIVVIGFYMPFYLIGSRAKSRQHAIIKSLPDAFDLITTCVEAGLGLDAALARVAEKVEGPFADELARALRDISLGKSRRDALKELGDRTGVPDLISFTNAVIQAEAMGSSVGQVLRVQADQLRVKRRQRAEKAAYQAPVKMLFPLVMCIFPTLFIVILGPAIITIMNGFPK